MGYNMGKLYLDNNGYYRDVNGNKVGKKGQSLYGAAWKYLANKYGRDYANNASKNIRLGNTYQNGKWTPNNQSQQGQEINKSQDNSSPSSIAGKAVKWFGDATGLYKTNNNVSDLIGTAAYFTPLGNVLSAGDAINDFRNGDYGSALLNAAFALPVVGNVGRGLQLGLKTAKLAKSANLVGKGVRAIKKSDPFVKKGLNVYMTTTLPGLGMDLYNGYNDVAQQKNEMQSIANEIKKQGLTDEQVKSRLGEHYNGYKMLTSRDNSFTGNLETLWDTLNMEQ